VPRFLPRWLVLAIADMTGRRKRRREEDGWPRRRGA